MLTLTSITSPTFTILDGWGGFFNQVNSFNEINETQIIKAIVISNNPDILPSFITFNTYFIDEDHTLPVISPPQLMVTLLY